MKNKFCERFAKVIAVTMSAVIMMTLPCFAQNSTLKLTADPDSTVRSIGLEMFGVGGEWGLGASGALVVDFPHNSINTKLVNDLKENDLSFGFYRQAGASSTSYRWKNSVGPVTQRQSSIGASSLYSVGITSFGVSEHVKLARAFEGDNAIINYTVSMVEEKPEDIADLAEFYYGDGTVNYNGGTNWAKVRMQNGIKDPVNVYAWELGNEYDASQTVHMFINSDMYVQQCREYIAAIKSVNPDAKIAVPAPMLSAAVEGRESYWTYNALLELEPLIDYVVIHGYVSIDNAYKRDKEMLVMADELKTISGGRIKIINTEYNAQGTLSEKEGSDATAWGYGSAMYFSGARTVMDAMCRNIKNPEIVSANYYSASDGTSYSLCYLDSDNKYKLNATGYVLSMLQNYAAGDVVDFSLDGFELNKKSECSAIVVRDSDGYLNVILLNNTDDKDFYIDFDFGRNYELYEIQTVSADKPHAMNYIGINEITRDVTVYETPVKAGGYELKKLSFAALKLKEAGK